MSAQYLSLTPQDAWFFRDGQPYNLAESNQADVESVFPPPARTVTGAIRAALARANGWDGLLGGWPAKVKEAFGSGPNDLGKLQCIGPFLLQEGQPLWPISRHILGRSEKGPWTPKAFLRPSRTLLETDQGKRNLPEITPSQGEKCDGLKSSETAWLTIAGLTQVLAGELPQDAIFQPSQLWRHEARVGLERDHQSHKVGDGNPPPRQPDLYSPSYVRLCRRIALGTGFTGLAGETKRLPTLFPFGGESRLAQCDPWSGNPLPEAPSVESFKPNDGGLIEFSVILLTPGRFVDLSAKLPGAKVISACVGKPVSIGGWDSLKKEPLPLESFHPAGSIWFCEAPDTLFRQNIFGQHGRWIGGYTAHGFGQIVIGHWPQLSKTSTLL